MISNAETRPQCACVFYTNFYNVSFSLKIKNNIFQDLKWAGTAKGTYAANLVISIKALHLLVPIVLNFNTNRCD